MKVMKGLLLHIIAIFFLSAIVIAAPVLEPPFAYRDSDNDGINDLFRDANGDGIEDISGTPYKHDFKYKDADKDGKNDLFQDFNGDGDNDLYPDNVLDYASLDADKDGLNDVTQKKIEERRNTFLDLDRDGIDDRHSVLRRGGNRGRGGGRHGRGGGSGFSGNTGFHSTHMKRRRIAWSNWDHASRYMKKKFRRDYMTVTGVVGEVQKKRPLAEMPMGVTLLLKSDSGKQWEIDLGPEWFITKRKISLTKTDSLTIEGYETQFEGRTFIIAYTMTLDNKKIELRDKKGYLLVDSSISVK